MKHFEHGNIWPKERKCYIYHMIIIILLPTNISGINHCMCDSLNEC